MTYEFHDILEQYTPETDDRVSSDTLYFVDEEKTLEELFNGWRTFTASNRGVGSKNISTAQTSGNGEVYLSQSYSSRNIEIKGQIQENLNDTLDKMNIFFSQDLIKFCFNDEKGKYFTGNFQISSVEEGTNTPEVSIIINLYDPFKYDINNYTINKDIIFDGNEQKGIFDLNDGYRPTKITFTADMTENITFTVVSNDKRRNGKRIKLTTYAGTHSGVIEFTKGGQLYINNTLSNKYLDISSDIYSFVLGNGDKVSTNATSCMIEFNMKGI